MRKELDITLAAIKEEAQFTGGELERIYGIFSNRIEKHRTELLSPVNEKTGIQSMW